MPENHDLATINRQGLLRKLSGLSSDALLGTGVFGSIGNYEDPRKHGAKFDGVTDDTAAWQAAHDALPAAGGVIFAPVGASVISSVNFTKSLWAMGSGMFSGGTLIIPASANANVFHLNGSSQTISNLAINPFSNTQTGGSFFFLDSSASIIDVSNIFMSGWWAGVNCAAASDICLRHMRMQNGVATSGIGVNVSSGIAVRMLDIIETNAQGSEPGAGVFVSNCGDIQMIGCQWIHNVTGMNIAPGSSQVATSVDCVNSYFDNNKTRALLIAPTSTSGTAQRLRFEGCWFSSSGNGGGSGLQGVLIDTNSVAGTVDGVTFIEPECFVNDKQGMQFAGANTKNIKILGGKIAGNGSDGILINNGANAAQVIGATVGPIGSVGANGGWGINMQGTGANNVLLDGNDVRGNTSGGVNLASTGSGRRIVNNPGYNPVGIAAITVTASPFTYTAADTPESIMINGGTVSLVTVNGGNVFQQTNCTVKLAPGQSMVVTYTVSPGIAKQID